MPDDKPKRKRRRKGRRYNGTGSVYKLSGNRKNPWVARLLVDHSEDGKPLYAFTYHETSMDAEIALPGMRENLLRSPLADDSVEQVWERFKEVRFPKLSESTITGYKSSYKHWEALHKRRIADIKTSDLQEIINEKAHMSYSHLSKMRALMVTIFDTAAKDDIVKRNYASLIEMPKGAPEGERRAFSDEEMQKIREGAERGIPYADVILFMCYTGWRPTEMCNLKPGDLNMDNWLIKGGIKTDAGKNRIVPIHPVVQPIVQSWLDKGRDRIFTDERGNPLDKNKWGNRFEVAMIKIFGERQVVPYTTRHTCASILHAAGADHLTIAKILGHTDYKITAQTYTHVDLDELKKAISKLE